MKQLYDKLIELLHEMEYESGEAGRELTQHFKKSKLGDPLPEPLHTRYVFSTKFLYDIRSVLDIYYSLSEKAITEVDE